MAVARNFNGRTQTVLVFKDIIEIDGTNKIYTLYKVTEPKKEYYDFKVNGILSKRTSDKHIAYLSYMIKVLKDTDNKEIEGVLSTYNFYLSAPDSNESPAEEVADNE